MKFSDDGTHVITADTAGINGIFIADTYADFPLPEDFVGLLYAIDTDTYYSSNGISFKQFGGYMIDPTTIRYTICNGGGTYNINSGSPVILYGMNALGAAGSGETQAMAGYANLQNPDDSAQIFGMDAGMLTANIKGIASWPHGIYCSKLNLVKSAADYMTVIWAPVP